MPEEAANVESKGESSEGQKRHSKVRIIRDYDPEHGTITRQGSVICFSDSFKREEIPRFANTTPQPKAAPAQPFRPASAPLAPQVTDQRRRNQAHELPNPSQLNGASSPPRDASGRPPVAPPRARAPSASKADPDASGDRPGQPRGSAADLDERVAAFRSKAANLMPNAGEDRLDGPSEPRARNPSGYRGDNPDGYRPASPNRFTPSRSRSPEGYRPPSPNRFTPSRSRSPDGYRPPSPNRFTPSRSRSPDGHRPPSPNHFTPSRSRSPEGYRPPSPVRFAPSRDRSPTPVRSLGGGFGSLYNAASPTNFPDYIAGRTDPPSRPVLHNDVTACPLKPQAISVRPQRVANCESPSPSAFRCPACSRENHEPQEVLLTHEETICLSKLRSALDAEEFRRAQFVIDSVSSRNMAEWHRLFAHLSATHQRQLRNRNLEPKSAPESSGEKHRQVADLEVDTIIYQHCLDDLKTDINRMNFREDLAMNREISFLQDQVHGLRVQQGVWPDRVTQLEEENATLKEKLSENRQTVQQLRRDLTSTQDRLQEALCEQHLNSTSPGSLAGSGDGRMSSQDHRLMQRVLEDYDDLQREMDRLRAVLAETEGRLFEAMTDAAEKTKKMTSLEIDVQRLESENHALRRRSIYESSRAASTSAASTYNGLLDRGSASNASFRTRSAGRAGLWGREPSIDRQTVADLPRVDDSPVEDRMVGSNVDMMTMSLPPAAFQKLVSGSPSVEPGPVPRSTSPPARPPAPARPGSSSSALNYHDVKMIERQYDQLQNEKRRLEAALSHLPQRALNPRMRRECREERERLEASLDATERQIGALRMTLRQFNVLKSTA